MELDILIRGQSNAALLVDEQRGDAARAVLQAEVQRLLGFDGATDRIHVDYEVANSSAATIYAGTSFLGEWVNWNGSGWSVNVYEQALLNHVQQTAHERTATAVLWLHNEYDSRDPNLKAADWESAVRAEATLLRSALGTDAAHSPYMFVSPIPYANGTDTGAQAIRLGMEVLAADPSFNADIAVRALDIDMSAKVYGDPYYPYYGGSHMSPEDAATIAHRAAVAIAEQFAPYARPGSPVALAGGNLPDHGPQVISATLQDAQTLRVTVAHDQAGGLAGLDPDAAGGIGWSVRSGWSTVFADSARVVGADSLELHFAQPVPGGATLFYGYGYGRLGGFDQPGAGNAIYDTAGMPIWTVANGIPIGGTAATTPPPNTPTTTITDWNAVATAVSAYHDATGIWWSGDPAVLLGGGTATPVPPPSPAPVTDWNAVAAAITAYHDATGIWWSGDPAQVPAAGTLGTAPAPQADVDWNALAAQVTAHYLETGIW